MVRSLGRAEGEQGMSLTVVPRDKIIMATRRAMARRLSGVVLAGKQLAQNERIFIWQVLEAVAEHGVKGFLRKEAKKEQDKQREWHAIAVVYLASLIVSPVA